MELFARWMLTGRLLPTLVVTPLGLTFHRVRVQRLVVVVRAMAIVVMAVTMMAEISIPVPRVSRAVFQFVRDVVSRGITATGPTVGTAQPPSDRVSPRSPLILVLLVIVVVILGLFFLLFDVLFVRFVIVEQIVRVPSSAPVDRFVRQP